MSSLRPGRTPNLPLGSRCAVQFRNAAGSRVCKVDGCNAAGGTDGTDSAQTYRRNPTSLKFLLFCHTCSRDLNSWLRSAGLYTPADADT